MIQIEKLNHPLTIQNIAIYLTFSKLMQHIRDIHYYNHTQIEKSLSSYICIHIHIYLHVYAYSSSNAKRPRGHRSTRLLALPISSIWNRGERRALVRTRVEQGGTTRKGSRKRKKPGSKRCGPIKRGPGEDTREPRYRDRLKNRRRHEALVSRGFYREPVHRVCSYANSFGGGSESGGAASGGSRDEQARAGNYPIFAWFARHRRRVRTRREVFGDDWRKLKRGEKWNNFWKDCTNFFLFFFFKGINTRSFLF